MDTGMMTAHLRVPKKTRVLGRKTRVETRYPSLGTRIIYRINISAVNSIRLENICCSKRISPLPDDMTIRTERNPIIKVINFGIKAGLRPVDEQPGFISTPTGIIKKNKITLETNKKRPENRSIVNHFFIFKHSPKRGLRHMYDGKKTCSLHSHLNLYTRLSVLFHFQSDFFQHFTIKYLLFFQNILERITIHV